jgi:uncharacterized ferredoxin-like protein
MPILDGREQERQGIFGIANMMVVAARTAPKSGGRDDILTAIVHGPETEALAADMEKIATERTQPAWTKHARIINRSEAIVLIGARGTRSYVTNCGACGYQSCDDFMKVEKRSGLDFDGPNCIFKVLDMGIALGSAVKIAGILNADNRLYYRIGAAARRLHYMPEASIIIGIPLSVTGKNPNFDREKG